MLAIAETLLLSNDSNRHLYLYDTYDEMSSPTENDTDINNRNAATLLKKEDKATGEVWAFSGLEEVKQTMSRCTYNSDLLHFIKGKVEDTTPQNLPGNIALLRLDTDWYESTKHELNHLFPSLVEGGVLIIDDYGFWKGARKAVDEYFTENNLQILLTRMDDTGRMGIK